VPRSFLRSIIEAGNGADESVKGFALPVPTPEITVSAMWHPRMDADPVHRWLRNAVIAVCKNESRLRAKGAL
jgi:DNA-binding transcriptional LysR family regulator